MKNINIRPDLWVLAAVSPLITRTCPHLLDEDTPRYFSSANDLFACADCHHTSPPPPHSACDRCHNSTLHLTIGVSVIDACTLYLALCHPCLTQLEGEESGASEPPS